MRRRTSLPKPSARVLFVHIDNVAAGNAQAVAHTIIAREIGRGLGRRDDVVCRQRVFGVRQGYVDGLRAGISEPLRAALPERLDFRRHALHPVFLRNADAHAFDRSADECLVVRHRNIGTGGVLGVMARHRAQQDRAIAHAARKRPRLIERRRKRHDPPPRAAAVGRLQSDDAAEGRRLADRAAGIGPGGADAQVRCDRRRRSAR